MAGVDGVRGRWLVATLSGRDVCWRLADSAAGVLAITADCIAVGVDVPIGLPERGRRECDRLAAARLGRARASVFPAPVRPVLAASDYRAGCAASAGRTGSMISKQTWGIVRGVRDWDAVELPERVVEVHPELSFRAMAPAVDFVSKKTARGAGQRTAALAPTVDVITGLADLPADPALDDVLDALAAAWSAGRWAVGGAEQLGGDLDARGRPMRIVI